MSNGHDESSKPETEESPSWMPKPPTLSASGRITGKDPPLDPSTFELREVIGAVQAGRFSADGLRDYLGYYDKETLRTNLNADIDGYPAIFYIVATNDIDMIRQWIKHGGDPNTTWGPDNFPLLAFCILTKGKTMHHDKKSLATLLRFGASPFVIPEAFYSPYCRDLPEDGPVHDELHDINDDNKRWCTEEVRTHLTKALNLLQRYDLYRSSRTRPHSGREKELLVRQNADEVTGLHQMIIAQSIATRWLQQKLRV